MKILAPVIAAIVAALLSLPAAFAQSNDAIATVSFVEEANEAILLQADKLKHLQDMRQKRNVKSAKLISIDNTVKTAQTIKIQLKDGRLLILQKKSEVRHGKSGLDWIGTVEGGGEAVISFTGDAIAGSIDAQGQIFSIRQLSPGIQAFVEIDRTTLPPEHPPEHPSGAASGQKQSTVNSPNAATNQQANAITTPNIDILILYSPLAPSVLGDIAAASAAAIARMNESFTNSAINLRVSLAGIKAVPDDFMSSSAALAALTDATPLSVSAKVLRDQVLADVIVLVSPFSDSCGVARSFYASAQNAFAVVAADCFLDNLSMAHEVGHLIGAGHNVENDTPPSGVSYGHGYHVSWLATYSLYPAYNHTRCWHTIMSYPFSAFSSGRCSPDPKTGIRDPKINYWSNPNISYTDTAPFVPPVPQFPGQGGQGGLSYTAPTGASGCCNNAAIFNSNGSITANLSATPISTGLLLPNILTTINSLLLD